MEIARNCNWKEEGRFTKRYFYFVFALLVFIFMLPAGSWAFKAHGLILKDTTWSGDVLVTDGIVVAKGATLSIAPGTTVRVRTAETSKTDPEYLSAFTEITVRGKLRVAGSPARPVRFGSADGGKWAGIQVDGGEASIENASVKGAETGFYCIRCRADIRKSSFSSNDYGMVLYGLKPETRLEDVRIEGNRHGLLLLGKPLLEREKVVLKNNEEAESSYTKVSSPEGAGPGEKPLLKPKPNSSDIVFNSEETLVNDTIWSGRVTINRGLKISPGVKLLILPGTVVRFGFMDTNRDGMGESGITSQGTIWAMGTRQEPITFTSKNLKRAGAWDSISLMSSDAAQSIFEHCVIEYAYRGIHSHFSSLKIEKSVLRDNLRAIQFQNSQVQMVRNLIVRNLTGVQFRDASVIMRDNTLKDNYIGVNFFRAKAKLTGNVIEGNIIDGLKAKESKLIARGNLARANRRGISLEDSEVFLSGNRLDANWENGFYLKDSQVRAVANSVEGNGANGLSVEGCTGAISGNYISGNRVNGISFDGFKGRISGNTVARNGKNGISVKQLESPLDGNSIYLNAQYNLGLKTASNVEAVDNWWGTGVEGKIRKTIFDRKNDPRLGRVRIKPYRLRPDKGEEAVYKRFENGEAVQAASQTGSAGGGK